MDDKRNYSSTSNIPDEDFTSPFIEDMSRAQDSVLDEAGSAAGSREENSTRRSRRSSGRGGKRLQKKSGSSRSAGRRSRESAEGSSRSASGPAETQGWRTMSGSDEIPDWSRILETDDTSDRRGASGSSSGRSASTSDDSSRRSTPGSDRASGQRPVPSDTSSRRNDTAGSSRRYASGSDAAPGQRSAGSDRARSGESRPGESAAQQTAQTGDESMPDGYRTGERAHHRTADEKRQKAGKTVAIVCVTVLSVCYVAFLAYLIFFPRSTVSQLENRTLAKFPDFSFSSYLSGDYTADIATWFDDTVPNRDTLKNMSYSISSLFGLTSDTNSITLVNVDITENDVGNDIAEDEDEIYDGNGNVVRILKAAEPAEIQTEDDLEARQEEIETEEAERDYTAQEAEFDFSNGLMIVYQDGHWKCLSLFGGGSGANYAEGLNSLLAAVGDHVNIYSMPCPLSSQFYVPSNASSYSNDQSECIENVHALLDDEITKINLCPVLANHTEEDIYLRTDAHWSALGAYYAARSLALEAGVPFADISEYEVATFEGYVGTMYGYSKDTRLLNDPETFTYYVPTTDYRTFYYDTSFNFNYEGNLLQPAHGNYCVFMGADNITVKVTTSVDNGRKLLVVKDSFGNAEIPFYTSSFEEIYVTDLRYFELNLVNFIEDQGITDVLFTTSTFAMVGSNSKYFPTLVTQNAGTHVADTAPDVTEAAAADEPEEDTEAAEETED